MIAAKWTCPGGLRPHPASLIHVEHLHGRLDDLIDIHRCQACGTAYRCVQSEVNDWSSGGGDYSNISWHWQLLEEDEFEAVRSDPNYTPRSSVEFKQESGWRAEG